MLKNEFVTVMNISENPTVFVAEHTDGGIRLRESGTRNYIYNSILTDEIEDQWVFSTGINNRGLTLRHDPNDSYLVINDDPSLKYIPVMSNPGTNCNDYRTAWRIKRVGENGITEVNVKDGADEIYFDLHGRRVTNPSKGFFITGSGKKLILR